MCKTNEHCAEVYDAEYQALYVVAGRMLTGALRAAGVDRYDKVTWSTGEGESGVIDLEDIHAHGLLDILAMAGLIRCNVEVSATG